MKTKHFILAILFLSLSSILRAQLAPSWVARYNNGINNGTNQAVKMVLDSVGNIYVTGLSQNANSNLGYITIKYATSGTQLWTARFDSTNYPSAQPAAIAVDISNNIVVTGSALTVKYDANGNQLWTAPYAGTALAVDNGANIYVVGFSQNFGTVKLSPQGSNLWLNIFVEAAGPTISQSVLVDSQNNVYVSGSDTDFYQPPGGFGHGPYVTLTTFKYNSNGNELWKTNDSPPGTYNKVVVHGAALDSNNNLYLESDWIGGVPYFSFKYSSNGGLIWTFYPSSISGYRSINDNDTCHGLLLDNSNNVLLAGVRYVPPFISFSSLIKITNGIQSYESTYPTNSSGGGGALGLALDSANDSYVTGYSPGANSSNDIFTIKYGPNGNQLWVQTYNGLGNGNDQGNAIAVDKLGNVYVTGYETLPGGGTGIVTIKYPPVTIQKQVGGSILLQAQGAPNENFDVQASTNLQTWQDLGLSPADTNGLFQFSDTNASNARFYIATPQ